MKNIFLLSILYLFSVQLNGQQHSLVQENGYWKMVKDGQAIPGMKFEEVYSLCKQLIYNDKFVDLKCPIIVKKLNKKGVISAKGKIIIPIKFNHIYYKDSIYIVEMNSGARGVMDRNGLELIPIKYKGLSPAGDCFIFREGEAVGLMDKYEQVKIQPEYKNIVAAGNYFIVTNSINRKQKIVNIKNEDVIGFKYKKIFYWNNHFVCSGREKTDIINPKTKEIVKTFPVSNIHKRGSDFLLLIDKESKKGVCNSSFELILPIEYDEITQKQEGFVIKRENQYGFTDSLENEILPLEYEYINYESSRIIGGKPGIYQLYDKTGKPISEKFSYIKYLFENLYKAWDGKEWLLLNELGQPFLPEKFPMVWEAVPDIFMAKNYHPTGREEGHYVIVSDGKKFGLLDKKGSWLNAPEFEQMMFVNEYMAAGKKDRWYLIHYKKGVLEKFPFDEIDSEIIDDFVLITGDYKYLINTNTGEPSPIGGFEEIQYWGKNYKPFPSVKKDGKWGMISDSLDWVISPKYEEMGKLSLLNGRLVAPVRLEDKWMLIDWKENQITKNLYDYISIGKKHVKNRYYYPAVLGKKIVLLDQDGMEFTPTEKDHGFFLQGRTVNQDKDKIFTFDKIKYGGLSGKGQVLYLPEYEQLDMEEDFKTFKMYTKNGKMGYGDPKKDIPPVYENIQSFSKKIRYNKYEKTGYIAKKKSGIGAIDLRNRILIPFEFENIEYKDNFFLTFRNNKYGLYSEAGIQLMPQEADFVEDIIMRDSWVYVKAVVDNLTGIYDCQKKDWLVQPRNEQVEFWFPNKQNNNFFIKIKNGDYESVRDGTGKIIIPKEKHIIQSGEKVIPVYRNGKWGVYDTSGKKLYNPQFEKIKIIQPPSKKLQYKEAFWAGKKGGRFAFFKGEKQLTEFKYMKINNMRGADMFFKAIHEDAIDVVDGDGKVWFSKDIDGVELADRYKEKVIFGYIKNQVEYILEMDKNGQIIKEEKY